MTRDKIIIELNNNDRLKGYAKKLSPNNYEDVFQEFLLIMMDKVKEDKLSELHALNEVEFYSARVIKSIVVTKGNPLNKALGDSSEVNMTDLESNQFAESFIDTFASEEILEQPVLLCEETEKEDDLSDIHDEVLEWLTHRSLTIAGEYYYEKLFRMHFCDALTYREIEEITKIPKSEICQSIKLVRVAVNTKFKNKYDGIINN